MTPALFHQHHNQPWPLLLFICAMDARMAWAGTPLWIYCMY